MSKNTCLHCLNPHCTIETCPTIYRCNTNNMAKLIPCSNPLCYNDSFKKNPQLSLCPILVLPLKKSNYNKRLSELIENKKTQQHDYLGLIGVNFKDKSYFNRDHPCYQLLFHHPELLETFVTVSDKDKIYNNNDKEELVHTLNKELTKNNTTNIQDLIYEAFKKINPDMMVVDRTGTQKNVFQKLYSLIETISLREKHQDK